MENEEIRNIELQKRFKSKLDKYDSILNKMEIQIQENKNNSFYDMIDESKIIKVLSGVQYKILYLVMFIVTLFLKPELSALFIAPIMFIIISTIFVKIMRALHETFAQIIYVFLSIVVGVSLVYYIFLAINTVKYFRTIWI